MLEKLVLWKFWKITKKTSLVAFLLKNSSCQIHPPITTPKTDFDASVSFVPRIFKIAGRAVVESLLSKATETSAFCNSVEKSNMYIPKRSFSWNFEKSLFNRSCRLWYTVCNATKNELLTKFLNGTLKCTEHLQEMISNGVLYQKFTDLQTAAVSLACF